MFWPNLNDYFIKKTWILLKLSKEGSCCWSVDHTKSVTARFLCFLFCCDSTHTHSHTQTNTEISSTYTKHPLNVESTFSLYKQQAFPIYPTFSLYTQLSFPLCSTFSLYTQQAFPLYQTFSLYILLSFPLYPTFSLYILLSSFKHQILIFYTQHHFIWFTTSTSTYHIISPLPPIWIVLYSRPSPPPSFY